MKQLHSIIFVGLLTITSAHAINIDGYEYGKSDPVNKQDGDGNTQYHLAALLCDLEEDVLLRLMEFEVANNVDLINPFLLNKEGLTAKEIAAMQWKKTGKLNCQILMHTLNSIEGMRGTAFRMKHLSEEEKSKQNELSQKFQEKHARQQ